MEAARVLKLRGHKVTLIEKEKELGGKIKLAAAAPHKDEFLNLINYYKNSIDHLGINYSTKTELADISIKDFDGVVIATGSNERRFPIKGEESVNVYMASQVLKEEVEPEGPVLIIGAGLVGGETADKLVEKEIEVSLIDMLPKPFKDMGATLKWVLVGRLRKAKTKFYMESTIKEIVNGEVIIQKDTKADITDDDIIIRRDDQLTKIGIKSLIFAVGYQADNEIIDQVKNTGLPYYVIGDAKTTRRIKDSVAEGYQAATDWVDGL